MKRRGCVCEEDVCCDEGWLTGWQVSFIYSKTMTREDIILNAAPYYFLCLESRVIKL